MDGVVSAVYDVKVGEVWLLKKIEDLVSMVNAKGLKLEVIESVPVPEEIKYDGPDRDRLIENYKETLVNCAKCGIRANTIAPGFFSTKQNAALLWNKDGTPTARTGKILKTTPMKRFGETKDLIGTLLWLLSDDASGFVTGAIIPADGGFNAYSRV